MATTRTADQLQHTVAGKGRIGRAVRGDPNELGMVRLYIAASDDEAAVGCLDV